MQFEQHVIYRLMARPKLTWKKLMEKLTTVDPQERSTWRSGVRSAMRAASQLPGRGPLMWMMPLHLHVNKKSDYDDYDVAQLMTICNQNADFMASRSMFNDCHSLSVYQWACITRSFV